MLRIANQDEISQLNGITMRIIRFGWESINDSRNNKSNTLGDKNIVDARKSSIFDCNRIFLDYLKDVLSNEYVFIENLKLPHMNTIVPLILLGTHGVIVIRCLDSRTFVAKNHSKTNSKSKKEEAVEDNNETLDILYLFLQEEGYPLPEVMSKIVNIPPTILIDDNGQKVKSNFMNEFTNSIFNMPQVYTEREVDEILTLLLHPKKPSSLSWSDVEKLI